MSDTAELLPNEKSMVVGINQIEPNPWNPNVVPDHIMKALAVNMQRAGFNQPLLVRPISDKVYQIVDGQHRYQVAKEAGFEELPVIVRTMTESEAKAQTIAMNKLRGEMEPADVAALVKDIMGDINLDELATFSGFQMEELEAYVSLADFDFSSYDDSAEEEEGGVEEAWVTMTFRVPSDVEPIIRSEIERVKGALRTEHDSVALEAICVNSANTSIEEITGGD